MSKSLGISYHLHTMAFGAYFFCTPLSMSRFRLCGNFLMRTNDSTILRVCACVVFDVIHQLQFDCQLNFFWNSRENVKEMHIANFVKMYELHTKSDISLGKKQQWISMRCDRIKILCVAQNNKSAKIYYSSLVFFTTTYRRHNL